MQDSSLQDATLRGGGKRKRVTHRGDATLHRSSPLKKISHTKAKKPASFDVQKAVDCVLLSDSEDEKVLSGPLLYNKAFAQTRELDPVTYRAPLPYEPALAAVIAAADREESRSLDASTDESLRLSSLSHRTNPIVTTCNTATTVTDGLHASHQITHAAELPLFHGPPVLNGFAPLWHDPKTICIADRVEEELLRAQTTLTTGASWAPPPLVESDVTLPTTCSSTGPQVTLEPEPQLCKEQADLVDLICSGRNVFYTGSAGCGKSTVLKAFVKRMRAEANPPKNIHIIAPTGRAALDIGGSTSWTYAGWTPDHMKKPLADLCNLAHGKFVNRRLRGTDVLVIDEISMMENHHFERLNAVMKAARSSHHQFALPFGGVQLIVTGDFCQLPPVKPFQHCITCGRELLVSSDGMTYTCETKINVAPDGTTYPCANNGQFKETDKWAFRSAAWEECKFHHVNLTTIHRQNDRIFIDILQNIRLGRRLAPTETDILLNHESNTHSAVRLFSTREEVRRINDAEFKRLRSREYKFCCHDHFRHNSDHMHLASKGNRNQFDNTLESLRDHRYEKLVTLKQGMLVVLQLNLDMPAGLVNGSQGVVVGWEEYEAKRLPKAPQNSELSRKDRIGATQTAHWAPILGGEHAMIRENNISSFINAASDKRWPIVLFQNGVTRTIYAHCALSELGDEEPFSLLSRTQIPLLPAWAMSVHKAQGMTLNRVIVDLSKAFEEGQVYVALSRARSLEGLKVEALGPLGTEGGNAQVSEFLKCRFGLG